MEPWKKILCGSKECQKNVLDENGRVKESHYLYPEIDNDLLTQFSCPICGKIETWGVTRRRIAKLLYERLQSNHAI